MRRRAERVLLALPGAFGPTGGIEMYNRLVIKGFHEVARERGAMCSALLLLDPDGHHDERYLDPSAPPPRGFAGSRPRFAAAVLGRVAWLRPDLIVWGHVNFGALSLAARALMPRARHWFLVHGVEVWQRLKPAPLLAVRLAERVLSVSEYSRRELVARNGVDPRRVGLLPDALDPFWATGALTRYGTERPSGGGSAPTILSVGRLHALERRKGFDHVIRALPEIARSVPEVRYTIVGDGTDRPRLEAMTRDLGVADRVEFRGRVSPDELAAAYAACSILAMPSAQEGFGIVFLEAALFGKPSIASAHGGSPEVVVDGDTGRLVAYGDVSGFAAAAIEMLSDPSGACTMGERARRRLEELFTYDVFLRKLRAHVEEQWAARRSSRVPMR